MPNPLMEKPIQGENPLLADSVLAPNLFSIPKSKTWKAQQAKEMMRERHNRKLKPFISQKNASILVDDLPESDGDSMHVILRGDFVLGDFLPLLKEKFGRFQELICTTLSMSIKNCEVFEELFPFVCKFKLLISSYFFATDKSNAIGRIQGWTHPHVECSHCRQHTKIILARTEQDECFVFETSANLRSSGCIEHISIFKDAELYKFHVDWIDEVFKSATRIK